MVARIVPLTHVHTDTGLGRVPSVGLVGFTLYLDVLCVVP